MSIKDVAKAVIQRMFLSGRSYENKRQAAIARSFVTLPDAREKVASISPRPEHMHATVRAMPEASIDVTVIVPVYNVDRYVVDCLESILLQDVGGRSLEVIAVDDGSTDSSGALVDELAHHDERLVVVHQANLGLSGARNTGLEHAHGRLIAFVDSDDMIAPGHLGSLLNSMDTGKSDVVSGLWQYMSESGSLLGIGEQSRTFMAPWGRLYRRSVWERLRFPLGCWYEDLITPCCIQPLFAESFVSDAGYLYRLRPGSIVSSSTRIPRRSIRFG